MKALFNDTCDRCCQLRPRCALVITNLGHNGGGRSTLCEDCRKVLRGKYRLDERHKGKAKL